MTEELGDKTKRKWDVRDYVQSSVFMLVVGVIALVKGLGTYNSTGDYQPGVGYAEHGDAGLAFLIAGIALLTAVAFGIVAAVAKGNQVGRE